MSIKILNKMEITDEDIQWAEEALGHRFTFNSERTNIIKNMDSKDIQAFPGSGKTTILVAKLAILAKKWSHENSGICVLSHTNVAREEIEERLGNSDVGRKLLSYPHFIGTVHSFFNTYIALPWIHSKGLNINIIDSESVLSFRWGKLPQNTRYYLEKQNRTNNICSYKRKIGEIDWDKGGETKKKILDIIEKSQREGYFTFDEMLLFAEQALEEWDEISTSIQQRFPILFIDEAQDTDDVQWRLIEKAFDKDGISSIRQGYGDSNQAIYSNLSDDDVLLHFPRVDPMLLSESKRFDSRIANLANAVALSAAQMDGSKNTFSEKEIPHTIFLFSKDKATNVINEFGQLILDTFTDKEINEYQTEGCHAIGMIHNKKEDTSEKHFPKGVYDYWELFESKKAVKKDTTHKYLIQYFRQGIIELQLSGEKSQQIRWISKGLKRMINDAKKCNYIPASNNTFHSILITLSDDCQIDLRRLIYDISDKTDSITELDWSSMINKIKKILKLFDITIFKDFEELWKWVDDEIGDVQDGENTKKVLPNHYIYTDKETERIVDIEFGSIHSVKGRTHLATLVLETYMRTHNIKAILKHLYAAPPKSVGNNQKRLKCQYVAMTRARALICIAIPKDFVDRQTQDKLRDIGWNIKFID